MKILLADGDPGLLREYSLRGFLGSRFFVATDGREALEILKNEFPDIAILELMLPGADGHEILKILAKMKKGRPKKVIIFTSVPKEIGEKKCLELGADGYFCKNGDVFDRFLEVLEITKKL